MPIILWPPSVKQVQAFHAGLSELLRQKRISRVSIVKAPLPIYNVGLRDVLASTDISAVAKLVSWRYFAVGSGRTAAVSGDVDLAPTPRLTSLSYGKAVGETLVAVEGLANLPDLQADPLEPRLLRIPGLLLECFWLTPMSQPAESDWVIPYHTLIENLDKTKAYRVNEFLETVRPLAVKALAKPH